MENYNDYFKDDDSKKKFQARFEQWLQTADDFIKAAGYEENVVCNERIMMQVLLDYYADIRRLKDFHDIEKVRTEKVIAYTVSWIIKRKPLQFIRYSEEEKDIFVNERFAVYLTINECMLKGNKKYVSPENSKKMKEYISLLLYYFKYRECNPQVVELAIESFKMGTLVE